MRWKMDREKEIEELTERLKEVRGRIVDIEENTSRYCELGEWRISGYDAEEAHDELHELQEAIIERLDRLEEQGWDE
jgi:chaperonin cofactor prefoldin